MEVQAVDWQSLALIAFLAAPIAMLVTQMGKKAIGRIAVSAGKDPFWYQWGLRLLSAVVGSCVGMLLLTEALAWGAFAGAAGGALASTIVALLRKQIRNLSIGGNGGD